MLGGARMCISIEGKVTKFNAGHSSYSVHWCIYSYPMFVPLTTNLLAPRRKVLYTSSHPERSSSPVHPLKGALADKGNNSIPTDDVNHRQCGNVSGSTWWVNL